MRDSDHTIRIVVTGGGSGGHTMPAMAAITRLREEPDVEIEYVGSAGGIEREAAANAGLPYHAVRTGKLRRASHWSGLLTRRNVADIAEVVRGTAQCYSLLGRLRPAVVLGTGGFVAVPVVWAAWARRVPIVIHEQTLIFGLANRLCAPAASAIALSTPLSLEALRPAWHERATVTGNPVREGVVSGDAARAAVRFGLTPGLPTVFITGGALGAERLNHAVLDALPQLLTEANVIHQCGAAPTLTTGYAELSNGVPEGAPGRYVLSEFLDADAMGDAYASAALVVSRSGAGTTNELAATGSPSLLVPLVPTGGDEQRRMASSFAGAGASVVVADAEFDGPRLAAEVRVLLADPARLDEMGSAAAALAANDATRALAELVLRVARGGGAVTRHAPPPARTEP